MLDKWIFISRIWDLMQRTDAQGKPIPFSIKYRKKSTGEMRYHPSVVLTSFHSKGNTLNILPEGEIKPKKIRRILIMEFNEHRVII